MSVEKTRDISEICGKKYRQKILPELVSIWIKFIKIRTKFGVADYNTDILSLL